mmetsp:Transcript_10156/g.24985  ORF Transcript_10156/g.24985 Transcript_10156/m.24985 type:complete len:455 (-) Transcript_10156:371-1735(-)
MLRHPRSRGVPVLSLLACTVAAAIVLVNLRATHRPAPEAPWLQGSISAIRPVSAPRARLCPSGSRALRRNGQLICRVVEEKETFIDYVGRNKDLIDQFVNKGTGANPCPPTKWNSKDMDIVALRANPPKDLDVEFPLYISPADLGLPVDADAEAIGAKREEVRKLMLKHGALVFRGFESTKTMEGYRDAYKALGFQSCEDPLEGTFLRKNADKEIKFTFNQNPTHYVGMHTECTHTLGPVSGAFWCGNPASVGGEFTLLDGRKMFYDLNQDVLERFYNKDIRIKVVGLPAGPLANVLPRGMLAGAFEGLAKNMPGPTSDLMTKYDLDFHVLDDYEGVPRFGGLEPRQSPLNRHPVTNEPLWFCNIHNHARYLSDRRPNSLVEIARADVYFGDNSVIPPADVQHIDDITRKNLQKVAMQPGDIVLLDNYRVLHGRENFTNVEGNERKHCVTWFEN